MEFPSYSRRSLTAITSIELLEKKQLIHLPPTLGEGNAHVFYFKTNQRDELLNYLQKNQIEEKHDRRKTMCDLDMIKEKQCLFTYWTICEQRKTVCDQNMIKEKQCVTKQMDRVSALNSQ